jgi:uncharacterized protein
MKIVIAGGTGFLGYSLRKYFENVGHDVIILTRNPRRSNEIYWTGNSLSSWCEVLEEAEVLINLSGRSVDCRYNDINRKEIYDSRIIPTKILQKAIECCKNKPKLWLNASSATIYTHAETIDMTEANGIIGDDFSMGICKAWEAAFMEVPILGVRKVAMRTSIVLGDEGGAWPKIKTISKWGLGGTQGNGRQYVSSIDIRDFCRSIHFIILNDELSGPVNITSPKPMTNKEFMSRVAVITKPWLQLPSPTWLLELASVFMRTETELLLKSRRVVPEKLLNAGFLFKFQDM